MHQLIVALFVVFSCATGFLPELELGDPVPTDAKDTGNSILVSPGQTQQEWIWLFKSVEYVLGVDQDGLVQYLSTSASGTATPEGVQVGQSLEALQQVEGVTVVEWPEWGFVASLPSGWKAALFPDESDEDWTPKADDKIDLLFLGTAAGYGAGK